MLGKYWKNVAPVIDLPLEDWRQSFTRFRGKRRLLKSNDPQQAKGNQQQPAKMA
jgi:hypothetical protein